jgi:uncharacterized membrane protein
MILETVTHLLSMPLADDVCATAPPGVQDFADKITSWVKWGVLALIVMSGFISVGAIVGGRITNHPQGARYGAMGLVTTIIAAILFVTVYAVVTGITGNC